MLKHQWLALITGAAFTSAPAGMLQPQSASATQTQSAPTRPSQTNNQEPPPYKVPSAQDLRARTAEERARAEFFDMTGLNILEVGSVAITSHAPQPEPPGAPDPPGVTRPPQRPDPDAPLLALVCRTEAILVGRAEAYRVWLNKSETFLFTDYSVFVEKWIKGGLNTQQITVSKFGGEADVNGKIFSAAGAQPLPLKMPLVFFLKRIKGGNAFAPSPPPLAISRGTVSMPHDPSVEANLDSFTARLAKLATSCKE